MLFYEFENINIVNRVPNIHIISVRQLTDDLPTLNQQKLPAFARLLDEERLGGYKW